MGRMSNHSRAKTLGGLLAAVGSAIVASACCVGPLLLLSLGVSGAWISHLTRLEPYRPVFVTITMASLALAFYQVYRRPQAATCPAERTCAMPGTKRAYKTALWIVLALILGLLIFPYLVPQVFAGSQIAEQREEVTMQVRNMTCGSCTVTVKKSLMRLEGVKHTKVTLNPPEAAVVYDPVKIKVEDLIQATTNAGYPSSVKRKGTP